MRTSKVLITGGAGYIGTHTIVELYNSGYEVIVYDNLDNSSVEAINRVEKIIKTKIIFIEGDIRNKNLLNEVFQNNNISSVIHFAGLKAVGESVQDPLYYYNNNITGTLVLLEAMLENNCKKIVFSSSATVYGDPEVTPITENSPIKATNPYGRTKIFAEEILKDINKSDDFKVVILRYFNPVGAHESGTIGEDPNGIPNNLMPFISQVAVGKRKEIGIFGNDYDTPDGTGVRDYIHVVDLAKGHVSAIKKLEDGANILTINLGTGNGYSVLDVINSFEKASNKKINYSILPRREGDIATCFADSSYAKEILGWEALKNIDDMCEDAWRWQENNPNGYN